MKNIFIFGAGSIGNHFSHACSRLNYNIFVTDLSKETLFRMKSKVYPKRYGKWNNNIKLIDYLKFPEILEKNQFDLIIIGTPPHTHLKIFKKLNKYKIKNILVEKPVCSFKENPSLFLRYNRKSKIYCGYNHSVSKSFEQFLKLVNKNKKEIDLVQVKWNESWRGILNAHFWMKNEFDSYLGDYKLGGGAIQEHSHGLHLIGLLSNLINKKDNLKNFKSSTIYKKKKLKKYDYINSLYFQKNKTSYYLETNLIDDPPTKKIICFLGKKRLIYHINFKNNYDAIIHDDFNKEKVRLFKKDRTSEFVNELNHIFSIKNEKDYNKSNINIKTAINCLYNIKKILK